MFTWVKIKNGKVNRVIQNQEDVSPGEGFKKVPNNWEGQVHDRIDWFGKDMLRVPDHILIEKGIRKDYRGIWYNTENIGETKAINKLDEEPGDSFTKEKPPNEPFQEFDRQKNKWVINLKKKERAEKESTLSEIKNQIEEIEKKTYRPLREKALGIANQKSESTLQDCETEIENLRSKLNKLENEFK